MTKIKGYPLLNNVSILYFIVILFVLNLGIFVYNKDNQSIFLISCCALIVYLFNNNMIIVLLLSMLIVNFLILINKLTSKKEGMDDTSSSQTNTDTTNTDTTNTDTTTNVTSESSSAPAESDFSTIEKTTCDNTELIKKINIAISGVKNSSEKLQNLDPALDIDLKDINAKLNNLYSVLD
jgi:hypothetical protein